METPPRLHEMSLAAWSDSIVVAILFEQYPSSDKAVWLCSWFSVASVCIYESVLPAQLHVIELCAAQIEDAQPLL